MQTNLLQWMAVICAASSVPDLVAGVMRALRERGALSIILAVGCGMLTATYVSAVFQVGHFTSLLSLWPEAQRLSPLIPQIGIILTLCCMAGNLLVWRFVRKVTSDNLWRWILLLIGCSLLLFVLLGFAISRLTGLSFDTSFFCSCCGFMGAGGVAWGLSYKEICVIGNIYLESGICWLSALWLTWACIKRYLKVKTAANGLLMALGILYGAACGVAFICVCIHYAMPMDQAFDLCYQELIGLTQKWNLSYNSVNYLIFIVPFVVFTVGSLLLARLIQKKG